MWCVIEQTIISKMTDEYIYVEECGLFIFVLEKEEDEEYIYKYSSELRVIRNIDRKKIKR